MQKALGQNPVLCVGSLSQKEGEYSVVSIIVPFYNSEKYIEQCLFSVQVQTYKDIEILCISDGSEDGSEDIVRKFTERDSRFRLLRQSRANAGQARNTGIKHAAGEYLCFLDSDDFLSPDMIEKMLNKCEEKKCDVCFCDADDYHNESGRSIYSKNRYLNQYYMPNVCPFHPSEISDVLFQASTSVPWGKLFRTAFIEENKIEFHSIPRNNDIYFVNMQIALAQQITYIAEVLVHHRVGITSNLQNGHYETPLLYSYVMKDLYRELQDRNSYTIYERSFLRLAVAGNKHIFKRMLSHGELDDFIKSCKQMYLELNLFDAFIRIGKSLIERSDRLNLDMFLDYVLDLNSLKQMDLYDASLEGIFSQTINILREKYVEVLQQLPFNRSGEKVGIYGAGKHTQGLFAIYKKLIGTIDAMIIYITSENPLGYKEGMREISYTAIDDSFDAIIVSSYIYNDEMLDNLSKVCGRTRMISFYPQYKEDIFAIFCEKDGILDIL